MSDYDFIIVGAGAAGLMLANQIIADNYFEGKNLLILDSANKEVNDRTWCFWEKSEGAFEPILFKKWPNILVEQEGFKKVMNIAPYQYKMVRGIDFYRYFLGQLLNSNRVTFKTEKVENITDIGAMAAVTTSLSIYRSPIVFDSRFDPKALKTNPKFPLLQQHFVGWFVKTKSPVFDEEVATFMDFSVPQRGNTRFMYVLPFSKTEALLEYTLFSANPLDKKEYEQALGDYLKDKLDCQDYEITDTEAGNIPMSCLPFWNESTQSIIKIGTAGGWTKASTGYTFYPSYKEVKRLVQHLKGGKSIAKFGKTDRFWYYDLLLIDILYNRNQLGSELFGNLFKKRKPQLVFKFLDEETSFWEDLQIMSAPSSWPFIRAIAKRIFYNGKRV